MVVILVSTLVGTALAERNIHVERSYEVKEEFYYQALTDVKDYRLTFPNYVKSVETKQNDLGNFADITAGGQNIGINIKMQYSADPTTRTFSALVTEGDYKDTKMKNELIKTWSFDGKNPEGATKVIADLNLHYGWLSPLTFFGDESIKFGMEQAFDKVADRAKVLQKNSGTQSGSTPTPPNPPVTNPPTKEPPKPTDSPKPPVIPKPTIPVKFPMIALHSSSVDGMTVTLYGVAQSGSGKTLDKISMNWGDGQTSTGNFPQTHTYSQTGTYHITAKVIDNGLSSSASSDIVISPPIQSPPIQSPPQQNQSTLPLVVRTDKKYYSDGETVIVTGEANKLSGNILTLSLTGPNHEQLKIEQININSDNKYYTEIKLGFPYIIVGGTYNVEVLYGEEDTATSFTFAGSTVFVESNIPVSDTDFIVNYQINGSEINRIVPETLSQSIIVQIYSWGDGELIITLPRNLIDSKINNSDDVFLVLVDGKEINNFKETKTSLDRTITIALPAKTEEIKIIGTKVMPKFIDTYKDVLELDPLPTSVKALDTIIFSGKFIASDKSPISGRTIHIKDDIDLFFDNQVAFAVTDKNGIFYVTSTAYPRGSGAYDFYAVFEGDSNYGYTRSETHSVTVN